MVMRNIWRASDAIFEKYSLKIFTSSPSSAATFNFQLTLLFRLLKIYQLGMVSLFSRIGYCLLHV